MTHRRVILELGSGNHLHGGDYTKAARRAVEDALHHSSLSLIRTLKLDPRDMRIRVTIGVQRPDRVDTAAVKEVLPYGEVQVAVFKGGLDIAADEGADLAVIASAAVAVSLDLPAA